MLDYIHQNGIRIRQGTIRRTLETGKSGPYGGRVGYRTMEGPDEYRNSNNHENHCSDQQNTGKQVKDPAHGLVKRHKETSGSNKNETDVAILDDLFRYRMLMGRRYRQDPLHSEPPTQARLRDLEKMQTPGDRYPRITTKLMDVAIRYQQQQWTSREIYTEGVFGTLLITELAQATESAYVWTNSKNLHLD